MTLINICLEVSNASSKHRSVLKSMGIHCRMDLRKSLYRGSVTPPSYWFSLFRFSQYCDVNTKAELVFCFSFLVLLIYTSGVIHSCVFT